MNMDDYMVGSYKAVRKWVQLMANADGEIKYMIDKDGSRVKSKDRRTYHITPKPEPHINLASIFVHKIEPGKSVLVGFDWFMCRVRKKHKFGWEGRCERCAEIRFSAQLKGFKKRPSDV